MAHIQLTALPRVLKTESVVAMRDNGRVPGNIYGFEIAPTAVSVDQNAITKTFSQTGETLVIDLDLSGASHPVIITELQRDPITHFITHVDFRRLDVSKKIEAEIPIRFTGISPAIKELGGIFVRSLEELKVFGKPDAMVHFIDVDIAVLKTFEDVIRVSDLNIPAGLEVAVPADHAVATVQPPRSDAEMASLNEAVDVDVTKIEISTEKKLDEADAVAAPEESKK